MNSLKKMMLSFTAMVIAITLHAQTTTIYGKVLKSDGSRLKGTSTMKGYEDQLIITNYTGGSDNTATIEIEVPTAAYVADLRNMIHTTAPKQNVAVKKTDNISRPPGTPIAVEPGKITTQSLQVYPITRLEIAVTNRVGNNMPTLSRQIIFENAVVESCTDIATSNTTKIKLNAIRIGWIYYSADAKGNTKVSGRSGWDTVTGTAWTNF